jgi:hypothetical protein
MLDAKEVGRLMIDVWEENLKLVHPEFSFTESEKHYMKMAFEAGYQVANKETDKKVQGLVDTLEELGKLGGPAGSYGNSTGNDIAIRALDKYRKTI